MTDAPEQDKREIVIEQARRYKAAVRKWETQSRFDPTTAMEQWREVEAAEKSLFKALEALDESGET